MSYQTSSYFDSHHVQDSYEFMMLTEQLWLGLGAEMLYVYRALFMKYRNRFVTICPVSYPSPFVADIDGLVQEKRNSGALSMALRFS